MNRILISVIVVALAFVSIYAYVPSRFYQPGVFTYWTKSDTSLAVNLDTANALTRQYIKRIADSATVTATSKDIEQYYGFANSLNGANDSVNIQLYGGVYHIHINLWDQYLDRVAVSTDLPGYFGPSTWKIGLPPVSSDSALIFRISRNASRPAGSRIHLTAYKVPNGTGLSFASTVGTYYDHIVINEDRFKAAGAGNTQMRFQFSNKRLP